MPDVGGIAADRLKIFIERIERLEEERKSSGGHPYSLRGYGRKALSSETRGKVWSKTDGHCFYCGVALAVDAYHVDHKTPISRGGSDNLSNLVPSCPPCNWSKGAKTAAAFRRSAGAV